MQKLAGVAAFLVVALVVAAGIALLRVIPEKPEKREAAEVSPPPPAVDPSLQKTTDESSINDTARFIKDTKKELTKYYPSDDTARSLGQHKTAMVEIAARYDGSKDKPLNALGAKAQSLFKELQTLARLVYAKGMEREMMDKGISMRISAYGANNTTLQVKYVLLTDAFVYQMRNKAHIDDQARALGFSKVVFTDGYDTTYTMKLD